MAIYHFSAKVISRANGSSAVASAAYRSASRLNDERLDRAHDFTNKSGVVHSEILAPEGSPQRWQDRTTLWNEIEAGEKRNDAQLAREIEFAIPREFDQTQGVELARDFVQREFVDRGMVADLNVHWDTGRDGLPKPHAHVMLSMRQAGEDGFGPKAREWNASQLLVDWREAWADHVNGRLVALDIDTRIDHRTLAAQGIELEPQNKIGPAGCRREGRGEEAERALEHHEIARRNGERIIADPSVALDAITRQQSSFTDRDLARFIHRHSDGKAQFDLAMSAVKTSPERVALGLDGDGRERFSTRDMIAVEQRLERAGGDLVERQGHGVSQHVREAAEVKAQARGLTLSAEQSDALVHITRSRDLSLVVGYAGTGKSAMLGVAREAWEAQGYQVRGSALSGIAAESLEAGSGIGSRTLASLEHGWAKGRDELTSRDVLVIDEAGMVGSRQLERVLSHAEKVGAKVVLVGDAEQLQSIEAGAAFRALTERHGAAEITQIRRQKEEWQRQATRELATGRTAQALARYEAQGLVERHQTREEARSALVDGWDRVRQARPDASQVMLAHTRADVAELNQLARARMRDAGALGEDREVATDRGLRSFATGDRVMFLKNECSLGVKNGTLGTLEHLENGRLSVRLDGGDNRQVQIELKDYAKIDHGYASTIHKSQGITVDRAHLLATDGLDRHAAYVGMSRHRETVTVHYGGNDFKDAAQLARILGRERAKDTTLDYREPFAERRGLVPAARSVEHASPASDHSPKRSMFDGLKLARPSGRAIEGGLSQAVAPSRRDIEMQAAIAQYAAARADIARMTVERSPILPHQEVELKKAGERLHALSRETAADLRTALNRNRGLAAQGATPEGMAAIQSAIAHEGRVRRDPDLRAERFIGDWSRLQAQRLQLGSDYRTADDRKAIEGRMTKMAQGLAQDSELTTRLQGKRQALGLKPSLDYPDVNIGDALVRSLSVRRSIELEL
jgi:Ti-type conjugative transfer relaxase TraA